ncbi:GcrA family cell cycle regulator [Xanthobacteraceae bacterium Astr-EGSB]|uniref:GcrA family cell cycle regulator n=1 Tax=Astrobacterium formosum TaxID=3069710 RepID=UPI0027AE082B|nr:GcrA family cell cycle regulator [Xanthobacteraceae bacterium Astr-EGSB]
MLTWPERDGWNDQRVECLKALWTEGLSAAAIAAELGGITRNAVIGKVHRLGLPGRPKTTASPRKPKTPKPPRPARMSKRVARAQEIAAQPEAVAEVSAPLDVRFPPEWRRSLSELTATSCRFPVGDPRGCNFFFCGAPALDPLPYCGRCARIVYDFRATRRSRCNFRSLWGVRR